MDKVCVICGEKFVPNSNRQKYCNICKEDATRDKYRRYDKKRQRTRQIGTTTIGVHPNKDVMEEARLIRNEKRRTLMVGTNNKGKQNNYDVWHTHTKEYGEDAPCGIQRTHPYTTFNDYANQCIGYTLTNRPPCPECTSTTHYRDLKRALISCQGCGLVLSGPPTLLTFKYPDYEKEEEEAER